MKRSPIFPIFHTSCSITQQISTDWQYDKREKPVCRGNLGNIELAHLKGWIPLNGTAMKRPGENSEFGTDCTEEGLKLLPSPWSKRHHKEIFVEDADEQRGSLWSWSTSKRCMAPSGTEDIQASADGPAPGSGQNKQGKAWYNIKKNHTLTDWKASPLHAGSVINSIKKSTIDTVVW